MFQNRNLRVAFLYHGKLFCNVFCTAGEGKLYQKNDIFRLLGWTDRWKRAILFE